MAELYQTLIPYRHNRRELSIESNGDYEMALCRMLAGERGFLAADEQLRRAIRAEFCRATIRIRLSSGEFAASRVSLAPDAIAKAEAMEGSTVEMETPASTPAVTARPTRRQRPATARAITLARGGALDLQFRGSTAIRSAPVRRTGRTSSHDGRRASAAVGRPRATHRCRSHAARGRADQCTRHAACAEQRLSLPPAALSPDGRRVLFCPSCGQNLECSAAPPVRPSSRSTGSTASPAAAESPPRDAIAARRR